MHTRAFQTLCLFALFLCAPLAHAQTTQPVYRCIGAQGEPVFSGQPCGTPAAQPGQVTPTQTSSAAGACAGSPSALRQAIAQAFAAHDVNQLAGLLLWRGMGQASARSTLAALSAWLKQPLTGIAAASAVEPPPNGEGVPANSTSSAGPAGATSTAQPPSGYVVSTGGVDGHTRDFGVVESGGCWWLTF